MTDDDPRRDVSNVAPDSASDAAADPFRVQAETKMIASNIDASRRVAPALEEMSVIDDIYAFAARLRAGSTDRSES